MGNAQKTDKVELTYITHAIGSILVGLAPLQMAWCYAERHCCDGKAVLAGTQIAAGTPI
jgi:hypothetical protein